jgi:hypothetical protein
VFCRVRGYRLQVCASLLFRVRGSEFAETERERVEGGKSRM